LPSEGMRTPSRNKDDHDCRLVIGMAMGLWGVTVRLWTMERARRDMAHPSWGQTTELDRLR
jgi:hypothetical protein